jgi:hypothetical protein
MHEEFLMVAGDRSGGKGLARYGQGVRAAGVVSKTNLPETVSLREVPAW